MSMDKPGTYSIGITTALTLDRHTAQAVAEVAVAIAFGLPRPSLEKELRSYGIHVMLRMGEGIPQAYGPGDLVVVCDVVSTDEELKDVPTDSSGKNLQAVQCVIKSVLRAEEDGNLQHYIENPGAVDLKKVIADWLTKRKLEVN